MASLPSTGSIVDYLNSKGQDSSFGARSKLFKEAGLDKTLGAFQGSANQNTTLLKTLSSKGSNPSFFDGKAPPNAFEGESKAQDFFKSPALQPFGEALSFNTVNSTSSTRRSKQPSTPQKFNLQDIIDRNTAGQPVQQSRAPQQSAQSIIDDAINSAGGGGQSYTIQNGDTLGKIAKQFGTTVSDLAKQNNISDPNKIKAGATINVGGSNKSSSQAGGGNTGGAQGGTSQNTPAVQNPETSTGQRDAALQSSIGISASSVLGNYTPPSEADLVNNWLESTEGKLELEKLELKNLTAQGKADATREALETKHAGEKEALENNLATKGLAFSGIRGTQVKSLADSLASSLLGVDRELATKLLDADINFRETVIDGVGDLLKSAQSDQKDAIAQLNKMGYAVVGDQIVPTLARENATIDDIRADANLAIAQRRLQLSEAANARAAANFGKGDTEKTDEFAILLALLDGVEDGTTDNEIISWGIQNTDLSSNEIKTVLNTRPASNDSLTSEAIGLVGEFFDKPGFSRVFPGDQTAAALKEAKEAAIKEAKSLEFNSSEERNLLIDFINTVTTDDL